MRLRLLVLSLALSAVTVTVAFAAPRRIPITDLAVVSAKSSNPSSFLRVGAQVFFLAGDGSTRLWRTDGTTAGTVMIPEVQGLEGAYLKIVGALGDAAVVSVQASNVELATYWRTDGTSAGTWKLGTLPRAVPDPTTYNYGYSYTDIAADSRLYVVSRSNTSTSELWVSDGAENSLHQVGNFPIGYSPTPMGVDGKLYFVAQDSAVGSQLWVSDGSILGTHMVRRQVECPGGSCGPVPRSLFHIGSNIYFFTETEMWTTDASGAVMSSIAAISYGQALATSSTAAYLTSTGSVLWKTNGTTAGTTQGPAVVGAWYPQVLDDGRLIYFSSSRGLQLWKSDGTVAATVKVVQLPSGSAAYSPFVGVLGTRVFTGLPGYSTGNELWSTDVDTGTPTLVKDIDPRIGISSPFSSTPSTGIALGSKLLFPATDISGRELWETDGTANGTKLLANIAPEAPGGVISGVVRDGATNAVIPGAQISICATFCGDTLATNDAGEFRFEGVAPGTYYIVAAHYRYLAHYYGGPDCPCPGINGTPVTVTAGFETAGINFAMTQGGTISGTVLRAKNGNAIDSVYVKVRNSAGAIVRGTFANYENGTWSASGLSTGSYYVETEMYNYGYDTPAVNQVYNGRNCPPTGCDYTTGDPVSVTTGADTTNINFSLHEYGTIAGTVRDASSSSPVGGAYVYFTRVGSSYSTASAYTDANGAYLSPLLNPGSYYVNVGAGNGYNGHVYPNIACSPNSACNVTSGTPVAVAVDGATTGIDMAVTQPAGRITGTLRDRHGNPLSGVTIELFDSAGHYVSAYGPPSTTSASGRYLLVGMPAGTYYLYLYELGVMYSNVPCGSPCNVSGATPVVVGDKQTVQFDMNIDAERTTISGRVIDAITQEPLYYNVLTIYGATTGRQYTSVYGTGNYSISVLAFDTSFHLVAGVAGYHRMAYQNARADCTQFECPMPAGAVTILAGTQTGFDFLMQRTGWISGTVYDETGAPYSSAYVTIANASGGYVGSATTDAQGKYRWFDSGGGSYRVYLDSRAEYTGQVYRDHNCAGACVPTSGDLVYVTDGVETTGIDFHITRLRASGKISGRVVDAVTGQGVPNVYVNVVESSYASARTDAQGYYTIESQHSWSVLNGQYHLYAEAGNPYYLALYGGQNCPDFYDCNRSGGTAVQVTGGNTTTGINFSLIRVSIASVAPAEGPMQGGTHIVVTGANFGTGSKLFIGDNEATILSRTATSIEALTPAAATIGAAHVTVKVSTSCYVTLAQAFTYLTTAPVLNARAYQNAVYITVSMPRDYTSAVLYRRPYGGAWSIVNGWSPNIGIDPTGPPRSTALEYRVDATVGGAVISSNTDWAVLFTDDPVLSYQTPIRRYHFEEVRMAVNLLRAKAGLPQIGWDDTWTLPQIRASHIATLRTAINEARVALGLGPVSFTGTAAKGTRVLAIHIQELRDLVR